MKSTSTEEENVALKSFLRAFKSMVSILIHNPHNAFCIRLKNYHFLRNF
jgi:hypothetical protein